MINESKLSSKIKILCQNYLSIVTPIKPFSMHLHEILDISKSESVDFYDTLQVYLSLVQYLVTLNLPVKPVLVIPLLSQSFKIEMKLPTSVEDLRNQVDKFESPSLVLLDWQHNKMVAPCEEYCAPLGFQLINSTANVYAYYREFRYLLGEINNWEYSRAVYVEYYPNGVINQ